MGNQVRETAKPDETSGEAAGFDKTFIYGGQSKEVCSWLGNAGNLLDLIETLPGRPGRLGRVRFLSKAREAAKSRPDKGEIPGLAERAALSERFRHIWRSPIPPLPSLKS